MGSRVRPRAVLVRACVALLLVLSLPGPTAAAASPRTLDPATQFFNPLIDAAPQKQINDLIAQGRRHDAELLRKMEEQSHAVWFTKGTPKEVRYKVEQTLLQARRKSQVAVIVAYNIPGRDCAGLSAGGALTTPEYKAWIDAFASAIGTDRVLIMLEPDGLGLLPSNCGGPNPSYPFTDAQRYEELNYAVDRLGQQPNALVYLDGTHSHWLGSGDIALRLVSAGVMRAQGLYVNVSNYQASPQSAKYGTWISKCIAFANNAEEGGWRLGHYEWCASQYFPANVDDFSTWGLSDAWYDANLGHAQPSAHFVIDTSRNGQGPWAPTRAYPDAQDWCNPPGRGVGALASAKTNVPLLDAWLWIKVPGESDGQCARGLGPAGTTPDPEWNQVDPAAGSWFAAQGLQLAQLASPALKP